MARLEQRKAGARRPVRLTGRPRWLVPLVAVAVVALGGAAVYRALTPGAAPLPAAKPLIQQAAANLQASRSFHFTYDVQAPGSASAATDSLTIQGATGEFVRPNALAATIQAATSGGALSTQIVEVGGTTYLLNPVTSVWGKASSGFDPSSIFDPSKGIKGLLAQMSGVSAVGAETVAGRATWRVRATVPGAALSPLVGSQPQVGSVPIDAWIAQDDRTIVQLKVSGALVKGEAQATARTLVLSGYNKPYKITAPQVK